MNKQLITDWINSLPRDFKIQSINISNPIGLSDFRVDVYEKIRTGIITTQRIKESYFLRITDGVVKNITKRG